MVDEFTAFDVNFNEFDRDLTIELFRFCTPEGIRNCASTFKKFQIVCSKQYKFMMRFSKNFEMRIKCRRLVEKSYYSLCGSCKDIPDHTSIRRKDDKNNDNCTVVLILSIRGNELGYHNYFLKNNSEYMEKKLKIFFTGQEGSEYDEINRFEKASNLDPHFSQKASLKRLAFRKYTFLESENPLNFFFFFCGNMYFVDMPVEKKMARDSKEPEYENSVAVVFEDADDFKENIQPDGRYAFDQWDARVFFEKLGCKKGGEKIIYDKIISISDLINMLS
jgi:hypothetical protein